MSTTRESLLQAGYGKDLRRYGKYCLVRKLAEGGMAEIFLAKQEGAQGFERNVVIKRMLKHLSEVPDFVNMFLDEARLATQLAHQNIVQINDLGLADGCYYICMEHLAGEDFSTVLRASAKRREYVPLQIAIRVILEACHGLDFAHNFTDADGKPLNIVHRDISPSNIFVTYEGQVKLLDFGIAKAESRMTQTTAGVVKGKYMYMAPEQARGHAVDRRADVFSLGVSLFEALTNTRPFGKDNDLAILNAVLTADFPKPRALRPDLPLELENIVLKAMSFEPQARYQTAGEMGAALERFASANTSATGGAQVAIFLRSLFGDERVDQKTRVPTLAALAAAGFRVPAPGQGDLAGEAATDVGRTVGSERTNVVRTGPGSNPRTAVVSSPGAAAAVEPVSRNITRSRGRGGFGPALVGGLVGSLVVAAVGAYLVLRPGLLSVDAGPAAVADATVATSSPDPVVPDASAPVLDAGLALAVDAGAPPKPPPDDRPTRAVKLSLGAIQKIMANNRSTVMSCFERHKGELAQDEGRVAVRFGILSTGRVVDAEVRGEYAQSAVGKCLEAKVASIHFPRHVNPKISLELPLAFKVER